MIGRSMKPPPPDALFAFDFVVLRIRRGFGLQALLEPVSAIR